MRSLRPIRSFLIPPLLVVMLVLTASVESAAGQTPNSSPPVTTQPPSSQRSKLEVTNTRPRRAAPSSAQQESAKIQTTSDSSDTDTERTSAPNSEIETLRDEINAASNGQARTRIRLNLVEHLVSVGQKQEAIAELKAMSEEDQFDPQGFYNVANAQVRLGAWEAAITTYRKAIEQRKGRYSRALNNLGVVLSREGRWDEAYEAFMSALRQESFRYAEASFNLGRLYSARGENDLAVREWRRALAVDPEHEAAAAAFALTKNGGNVVVTSTTPRTAPITSARRTADLSEKPGSTSSLESDRALRPSKSQRAGSRPLPAFTVDPETYTLLQRGRTARERGRNHDAVENYRRVLARMGGYFPPANLELGYGLIALKRFDEAIAALLPVTVRDGNDIPISHYHLGRLYELRGELKLAEDHYSRVAEAYGETNIQFILDVGRVREKQGNLAGALKSLEQYITGMEQQGQKPEWSVERLNALRQKLAAAQP